MTVYHKVETSICDPFKYKVGNTILIISIVMGISITIQRVKIRYCMVRNNSVRVVLGLKKTHCLFKGIYLFLHGWCVPNEFIAPPPPPVVRCGIYNKSEH